MAKKKFKIPDNLEEKFMEELFKQKMSMDNAEQVLDETPLGKILDSMTKKMPEGYEKEILGNKTARKLILGNVMKSFGITGVTIIKEDPK